MSKTYGRYYDGNDCREIVVEQDGGRYKVYVAKNGSCDDARRVLRFASHEKAVAAAMEMCRESGVEALVRVTIK